MYNKLLDEYFSSKLLEFEMLYIDEYKKKSELLVQDILGINKSDIYTRNYSIPFEKLQLLDDAFSKLKENIPVQHILSKTYFYDNEFCPSYNNEEASTTKFKNKPKKFYRSASKDNTNPLSYLN